jgi:hypothetical protein
MPTRRFENPEVEALQQQQPCVLMTTRFTQETWHENRAYVDTTPYACIYPSPKPVTPAIKAGRRLLVLEMNNDTNRIMGIGLVRNRIIYQVHPVYKHAAYNEYAYVGKHRLDRTDLTADQEQLVKALEHLCFRGRRHQKRMSGIKRFPPDMIFNLKHLGRVDLVETLFNAFVAAAEPSHLQNCHRKLE